MLHSHQIRAARAILDISQLELAVLANVHMQTIQKVEKSDAELKKAEFDTVSKIKTALEDKGIKFLSPAEKGSIAGMGLRYFPVEIKESKPKKIIKKI